MKIFEVPSVSQFSSWRNAKLPQRNKTIFSIDLILQGVSMRSFSREKVSMNRNGQEILGQAAAGISRRRGGDYHSKDGFSGSLTASGFFFDPMKTSWAIIALLALTVTSVSAQEAPFQITERGPHHRVWQRTTYETTPDGRIVPHLHQFTELASGLHFWSNGQWLESKEEIEILPDGTAAAVQGQHKAYFPGNIYQGVVELMTPDGKQLKSRPLGLSYDDGTQTVLITELKDSVGQLVGTNQIIYPDAFTDIKADLRYTYTKGGFEQDIILREQPLTPQCYDLDPVTTRLQVLTEFFNAPEPVQRAGTTNKSNELSDSTLTFGQMTMTQGKAFSIGDPEQFPFRLKGVPIAKSWQHLSGRTFLVEELLVQKIEVQLEQLPEPGNAEVAVGSTNSVRHKVSAVRLLPPTRLVQASTNAVQLATIGPQPKQGVVLDYELVSSVNSDFTLQGDTTYYVSGWINIAGTLTIEGGTVVKYPSNELAVIIVGEVNINCKADRYRPAIFTSVDDNSVGESWGTGSPSGYYGKAGLMLSASYGTINNMRFSYLRQGITDGEGKTYSLKDIQIVKCQYAFGAVEGSTMIIDNSLIADVKSVAGPLLCGWQMQGNNLTVHNCSTFIDDCNCYGDIPNSWIYLTNCLLVAVTNMANDEYVSFFTNSVVILTNDPGVFQTAGGGSHYLANNSPYRNYGTTNISPASLAELRQKTTYPPIIYSNITVPVATVFSPQAQRDTNTLPDLGYHYDPIDYAVGGVTLSNATVAVYPGAVIAAFGAGSNTFGLNLGPGVEFLCKGLATNWNRLVAYNTVQEQAGANWQRPTNGFITDAFGGASSSFACRFTDWSVPAQDEPFLALSNHTPVTLRDCQFHGGSLVFENPASNPDPAIELLNCLLERVNFVLEVAENNIPSIQNNLFWHGTFDFAPTTSEAVVQNNLFDQTVIPTNSSVYGTYLGGYNAYVTNFDQLQPPSTSDLVLTEPPIYQPGPLGNYYQLNDSRLINAGSTDADQVGLYDYTVLTNLVNGQELKETNSLVDIGYHYVAVDSGGNPLTTYTNGLPDYLVTSSMDALPDWWSYLYFGNLNQPANGDYDNDGTNNLTEYQNGTDPNTISFSFAVANQYVSTNLVDGVITILGGVPSSIAILVDTNNFTEANWTNYISSNITVDIGTSQGAHDVWIGLRGRLTNSYPTWQETTLILNSTPPTIAITNPTNTATFNASRVNVSGNFTAAALKQITVNSTLAFVNGTSFEARNVPLAGGANTITAIIEDLTGRTNAASITVTGSTNADGSLNDPVQLVATPIAGFAPLTVTFQITSNATPETLQQVLWDFDGNGLTDFVTNNSGPVTNTYATSGEYFPVVTLLTSAGRFSSIGGWNSYSLDSTNQPVRINVQMPPTLTTTLSSFPNPVDLKWDGTHLYVLSGSTATFTEFATNGDSIRSLTLSCGSPSGLDVDVAGNVYVALTASNQVWKFKPTDDSFVADTNFGSGGCIGLANGASGNGNSEFNAPYDVAVSPDGQTISVSDSGNHRIQQFSTTSGTFIASFGSQGSAVGQFNGPKGLTYDAYGTLYIVDSGNNRVVLVEGLAVMDVTGTNGNGLGQFSGVLNISVGKRGVYVAETTNDRIQKFDLPAQGLFEITSANVGFALSTGLSAPAAVAAVDHPTDELFYVADTGHNQVLLCQVPNQNVDAILAVWNNMKTCVANGDISGTIQYFSSVTAVDYNQDFLAIGSANVISAIGQIGTLTPASINGDEAEYYFQQSINGQALTFMIEFVKENGVWKIFEF